MDRSRWWGRLTSLSTRCDMRRGFRRRCSLRWCGLSRGAASDGGRWCPGELWEPFVRCGGADDGDVASCGSVAAEAPGSPLWCVRGRLRGLHGVHQLFGASGGASRALLCGRGRRARVVSGGGGVLRPRFEGFVVKNGEIERERLRDFVGVILGRREVFGSLVGDMRLRLVGGRWSLVVL